MRNHQRHFIWIRLTSLTCLRKACRGAAAGRQGRHQTVGERRRLGSVVQGSPVCSLLDRSLIPLLRQSGLDE